MNAALYQRVSILFLVFSMMSIFQGCSRTHVTTYPVPGLDEVALEYVRLAVALGEHDPDSLDYYYGPQEFVADIHKAPPSSGQIRNNAIKLRASLESISTDTPEAYRRKKFLLSQLSAVACRAGYLAGEKTKFDDEVTCSFGVKLPALLDEKKMASTRRHLAEVLPGKGTLAERYGKFEAKFIVPPAKLQVVLQRATGGCKTQTARHINIPSDESISIELTGDKPWAGYSRYKGAHKSEIVINTDFPLTVDRLLDLVCHETYPGHHMFNMMVDDAQVRKAGRKEFMVQPTYSPQSFLSEGAATLAGEVAFTPEERLQFEREVLLPLAGISNADVQKYLAVEALMKDLEPAIPVIARKYLDGDLEFVRTGEQLEREVLMNHYFETLKYLNEFRSYVVTYTYAPVLLRKELPGGASLKDDEQRWQIYQEWAHRQSGSSKWMH